jgi:RNA polymerase sigma factor (sigma-70 family)
MRRAWVHQKVIWGKLGQGRLLTIPVSNEAKKSAGTGSDPRLVKQCLSGNEEAWSILIEKYKALIYSIPIKYGLPPQEAAEVFQATCVELLERLPELRKPRALPKWLIQVAHHQCWKWKREHQRTVSHDSQPDLPEPEVPAIAETLLRQANEEQMLREAMAALSAKCRRLIELLFYEIPSRPYSEVAQELGLAVGSIGFTRQKCLERLGRKLRELGFG